MKMSEALRIIDGHKNNGYMVSFESKDRIFLCSDCFPDKHAGEALIKTEEEAWDLACKFADATRGKCVNIYVVDRNFNPVMFWKERMIVNR